MSLISKIKRRLRGAICRLRGVDQFALIPCEPRPDLTRLGGECAWVVPIALLSHGTVCYCVGAGEDISFDLALTESLGCEVHTFDPTPRAIEYVNSLRPVLPLNLTFHPWGLWDRDERMRFYAPQEPHHVSHSILNLQKSDSYFNGECKTLRAIMGELGHTTLGLLKLYIEGAEYKVIESLLADGIHPRILAIECDEIHSPLDAGADARIAGMIKRLVCAGYRLVVVDGPNYTLVKD